MQQNAKRRENVEKDFNSGIKTLEAKDFNGTRNILEDYPFKLEQLETRFPNADLGGK